MADLDLQIREGGDHPDPEIRAGGSLRIFFRLFGSQFGLKIGGGGGGGPPGAGGGGGGGGSLRIFFRLFGSQFGLKIGGEGFPWIRYCKVCISPLSEYVLNRWKMICFHLVSCFNVKRKPVFLDRVNRQVSSCLNTTRLNNRSEGTELRGKMGSGLCLFWKRKSRLEFV